MKPTLNAIIIRAMKDPSFKEELLQRPREVLEKRGLSIPLQSKVTVLEQSLKKIYVVIPTAAAAKDLEPQQGEPRALGPLEEIILRAAKDPAFKKELIKNTKKILELECDIELPQECVGEVVEERDDHFYLVIPYVPNPGELNDSELSELVAGVAQANSYISILQPISTLDIKNL